MSSDRRVERLLHQRDVEQAVHAGKNWEHARAAVIIRSLLAACQLLDTHDATVHGDAIAAAEAWLAGEGL